MNHTSEEKVRMCPMDFHHGEQLPCTCGTKESSDWEKEFDRMWPNQTKSREDLMGLIGNEYKPLTATEAIVLEQAENKRQSFKRFISSLLLQQRTELAEKIKGLKNDVRPEIEVWPHGRGRTVCEGENALLDKILTLLQDNEPV